MNPTELESLINDMRKAEFSCIEEVECFIVNYFLPPDSAIFLKNHMGGEHDLVEKIY